jgi:hypothetical protein
VEGWRGEAPPASGFIGEEPPLRALDVSLVPAPRLLVFVGAGGHAVSITDAVLACGYDLVGFVDVIRAGQEQR